MINLKRLAIQILMQLPDKRDDALTVLRLAREQLDWVLDAEDQLALRRRSSSESNVTSLRGRDDLSPR